MNKTNITDNILSINKVIISGFDIIKNISKRAKLRRLELNLTQNGLAKLSGVSLGSIKRFENTGEISLKHLIKIAEILNATEGFEQLFTKQNYTSLDEIINSNKSKIRKRGRKNV